MEKLSCQVKQKFQDQVKQRMKRKQSGKSEKDVEEITGMGVL